MHDSPMTTTQSIETARTAKAAAVAALAKAAPRTKRAALAAVEAADIDLTIAIRQHEQATRDANPTMTQAEVMQTARTA
jgi:hypothetical protein